MQPTSNQNIVKANSSLPSEAEFITNELINQDLDSHPVHEFLPLAELRADTILTPNIAEALNELIGKMIELEKTWDFIVSSGDPIGVELMNAAGQYAIVLASENDGFKIQYFDETDLIDDRYIGKSSHEAFEIALLEGFTELQPGMLEFLASLPSWKGPIDLGIDDAALNNHADLKILKEICMA